MKDEMCITVIATGFEAGGDAADVPVAAVAGMRRHSSIPLPVKKHLCSRLLLLCLPSRNLWQHQPRVAPAPEPEDAFNLDDILTVLNNRH